MFTLGLVFFLIASLTSLSITYYDSSNYWGQNEQVELSRWINKNIDSKETIFIDAKYEGKFVKEINQPLYEESNEGTGSFVTIIGLFVRNNLEIREKVDKGYFITKDVLEISPIHSTENGIFIYQL